MIALTLTTVANVLVTLAVGPLITALFARLFLRHRLPLRTWAAIALGGAGIGWMFGQEAAAGASLTGSLVAFTVPFAAAINWTLLQSIASGNAGDGKQPPDMLPAILVGALLSAFITLPFAWPLQASFHDIALLERPPARIAVVRRKDAFGDLLPVVAQAAKVVQEDASDATFERLAKAA